MADYHRNRRVSVRPPSDIVALVRAEATLRGHTLTEATLRGWRLYLAQHDQKRDTDV